MPIVAKLVLRRNRAWVQVVPGAGEAFTLPLQHAPAWLCAGMEVDPAAWDELRATAAYYTLLDKALALLARSEHFEAGLRRKLRDRERDAALVERVIAECRRQGYIDDARAAGLCAAQLVARGGVGRGRIKAELYRRGCPRELIDAALAEHAGQIDEAAEVAQLLAQRRKHFSSKLATLRRKLAQKQPDARRRAFELKRLFSAAVGNYLAAQGFSGDEARAAAQRYVLALLGEDGGGEDASG
jgi:SOS response regulatory protein OraA/RecX